MIYKIREKLQQSISVKEEISQNPEYLRKILDSANIIVDAYNNNKKVLFCGNGGSAADAQHLSAELSGRYKIDRKPLYAEALHVNSSYVTAVANDYSYDLIYERAVEAFGVEGDVLVAISTSGNSKNIVRAVVKAKEIGMKVIGLTGITGGEMAKLCDVLINIPSENTPNIQEAHITVGHIICDLVEQELFNK